MSVTNVPNPQGSPLPIPQSVTVCSLCDGTGKLKAMDDEQQSYYEVNCWVCGGTGRK